MAKWDDPQHRRDHKREEPPNSRLFIVCGKDLSEEDFQSSFSKFGSIEEIWIVKDKHSGEKKGVTYIKFSKTSEAALAMEEMNGKCISRSPRPLKVLIAHNRDQGSKREVNEEERLLRLFVVAPRSMSEQDLRTHFSTFGDVEHVTLVKDKVTKESKGFGYIKYHKMSHAALAFENCDRSFKAVFADPKPVRSQHPGSTSQHSTPVASEKDLFTGHPVASINIGVGSSVNAVNAGLLRTFPSNFDQLSSSGSIENGGNRLVVLASPSLNQDQLWRLFDIVPGLDYCDLRKKAGQGKGVAVVVYNNAQAANYAVEKLHGFEYPPGERLIVKLDTSSPLSDGPQGLDDDRGFPTGCRLPGEVAAGLFGAKPSPVASVSTGVGSGHGSGPGGGNGASNGATSATVNAMAAMAAAAAAATQAAGVNRGFTPEVARQVTSLMDTIATCQSLIQAASVNNDSGTPAVSSAGLVGNLLSNVGNSQAVTQELNPSQSIPPALGASLLAGLGGLTAGETYDPSYCSVKLPSPQPLAPPDSAVALRLFIVCYPTPPAIFALKDVFARFGGLIDVYILHNKSYGYAKYASKASAERAVSVMHGQEVCGSRLKVMVAADPHNQNNNANSNSQSSSVSAANSGSATASSSPPLSNSSHGPGSSPSSSCHISDADVTRKRIKMDVDLIDATIGD